MRIPERAAVSLSMAFHELATNAANYGALSNDLGRIEIEWRVGDISSGRELKLSWVETGGPITSTPTHRGFGSRLIEQGLRHELDSDNTLSFAPQGLRCVMRVPIEGKKT